ncbi:FadR family transcriptional regulator [Oceanispirochaeta crateris]|uniref:FadR family transcriptional regulator n=1 Tax=Oceanispirochaeta crateris TaxID=2518645 RepID=A0A5C1QMH3_9SPIO|nr:FadR/GntR family transcriptional regulator [Oceanispirochaeta crateris]QEN08160.1 FadR family transcriptional regulator [Oceanispirochaeta crateris]
MKKVQRQSVVDMASEQIKEFLGGESIQIGDKLPTEYDMCNRLNVSRPTLREVYRKLQSQGFLELKNGYGAYVKNKTEDIIQQTTNWFRAHDAQMHNYLEVRLYLDPLAAKLAAKNRTETDVLLLKKLLQDFEESYRVNDNKNMAEYDAKFHKAIVDITDNDLLVTLVTIVNYYFEQLRTTSFSLQKNAENALEPHRKIIEAIEKGDLQLAEDESIRHICKAIKDLCGEDSSLFI